MTKTDSSLLKSLVVFVLIVGIGVVTVLWNQKETPLTAEAVNVVPEAVTETSVRSTKGDKQLILRTSVHKEGTTTYDCFVDSLLVFTKTFSSGSTVQLPFNAWDPTDTYVFIEEKTNDIPNYYVIASEGGTVIDVGAVWREKEIPYTIRTATGWASGNLLIIYTSKDDGSKGPAYWFEVPSTAILQLAG